MVTPQELRAIYRLAQFLIIPTLFEGAGIPVIEAFQEKVPVACSHVTSLPEEVDDGALLFDPFSVEAISDAVKQISTNAELRTELILKGQKRLKVFSWDRTAKAYRALYRKVANRKLSEEDEWLLNHNLLNN